MAQSPVSPSPFDKVIKAAGAVSTNTGLVALSLVLLFIAFVSVLLVSQGYERLLLCGAILGGFLGIVFLRTAQSPSLPIPAGQGYLLELLARGIVIQGDSGKLIRIDEIPQLRATTAKALPPPHDPKTEGNEERENNEE